MTLPRRRSRRSSSAGLVGVGLEGLDLLAQGRGARAGLVRHLLEVVGVAGAGLEPEADRRHHPRGAPEQCDERDQPDRGEAGSRSPHRLPDVPRPRPDTAGRRGARRRRSGAARRPGGRARRSRRARSSAGRARRARGRRSRPRTGGSGRGTCPRRRGAAHGGSHARLRRAAREAAARVARPVRRARRPRSAHRAECTGGSRRTSDRRRRRQTCGAWLNRNALARAVDSHAVHDRRRRDDRRERRRARAPDLRGRRGPLGRRLDLVNAICLASSSSSCSSGSASYWPRPLAFFRNGWNVFDFIVIGAAFVPGIRQNATLLRLVRLLRVVRLVRVLPDLRVLLLGVWRTSRRSRRSGR